MDGRGEGWKGRGKEGEGKGRGGKGACTVLTFPLKNPCMWLWNHDSEFTKWQHPATHTWLWDDMPWNSPKRPPYWNSTSGYDFDHITAVDMSFCTSLRNFIQINRKK